MEVQEERPPPYAHNDPDTLQLPSVPTQDPPLAAVASLSAVTNGVHLPDLKSLGLPVATHSRSASNPLDNYGPAALPSHGAHTQQWQDGANGHVSFPRVPLTAPRSAAEMDMGSPMDTESIVSMDDQVNGNPHKSARNHKELLAAEAIVGLGNPDISSVREETLPPYDTERSPDYEERNTNGQTRQLAMLNGPQKHRGESSQSPHWSTRVMITTSGLGVALSEKSLRSLKFCLNLLREASARIGNAMRALRMVLDDFEKANSANGSNHQYDDEKGVGSRQLMRDMAEKQREEESRRLANRIKALSQDIWETIKKVCASVSQYTGGALPENASNIVRRQLLSVPQRWQAANAASTQNGQDGENSAPAEVRGANRMLAFAKEGLDMIAQVSMVVESTINSAEQWLDSLGRKRNDSGTPRDEKSENGLPTTVLVPRK
ncbi:putative clock controled protein (ccg-8) protein [Neofusicoccum parvum UCRNP2]|uniref:Putative clock controled protein (Ccg-8) protein n=1 Tax=Botryosphaeria parva (strain UCR-NP2) TaxID=1287680 RepID=R1GMC3_BOTPV|nr:putative clock controled protein (ccg-8) protein [Neofusicoccum parvum UCRNP2]